MRNFEILTKRNRIISARVKKILPNGTVQLAGKPLSQKYLRALESKVRQAKKRNSKKVNSWM